MLYSVEGGGVQPESELCELQVLRDVQGGDSSVSKWSCGVPINMQCGALEIIIDLPIGFPINNIISQCGAE